MILEHEENTVSMSGYYEEATGVIYLAKGMGKLEKECVYLHELQHKKCHKKKCICFKQADKGNFDLCEYHGFLGEVQEVYKRGSVLLARAYIKSVAGTEKNIKTDPILWSSHRKALRKIQRLKVYMNVVKLARSNCE